MEFNETKHEYESKNYIENFDNIQSDDTKKFSLEEQKIIKQEFEENDSHEYKKPEKCSIAKQDKSIDQELEANEFYEDTKHDFKTTTIFKLKNENETMPFVYNNVTTKPTESLEIKATPNPLFLKITKNLVSKIKMPKESESKECDISFVNLTHTAVVDDGAPYATDPLAEELQNNNNKKSYTCVHCGFSTTFRGGIIEHLLTHSKERPFMCAHCSYRTIKKKTLRKHIVAMHLPKNDQNSHENTTNNNCRKPFQCESCDASYLHRYKLKNHIKEHHYQLGNTNKQNIPICEICNFSSMKPSVMKNHALTHSFKRFQCEKCQISCSRNDALIRHTILKHPTEILFQCKSCDRKFMTEFSLLMHQRQRPCAGTMKANASPPPPPRFKCTVCTKAYLYKSVLDRHMVTHTKQGAFECSHCAERFATYTTLRYHIYSHSTESLFKCSACNFSTDHQSTMKTHEANHRKCTAYSCADCNYFTKKSDLFSKHRQEHNGKGDFQCSKCTYATNERRNIIKHLKHHNV